MDICRYTGVDTGYPRSFPRCGCGFGAHHLSWFPLLVIGWIPSEGLLRATAQADTIVDLMVKPGELHPATGIIAGTADFGGGVGTTESRFGRSSCFCGPGAQFCNRIVV